MLQEAVEAFYVVFRHARLRVVQCHGDCVDRFGDLFGGNRCRLRRGGKIVLYTQQLSAGVKIQGLGWLFYQSE